MATMATNHVTVAMGQVATTSLPRYSHFFISNYIIPSHYDQMLFFSVCVRRRLDMVLVEVGKLSYLGLGRYESYHS